jgi:hypothetical protein
MNILDYLPILALLAGGGVAFIFDRLAGLRRSPDKDRGDYWVFVIQYFVFILPFLLLAVWVKTLKPYWTSGYHLHFDLLPSAFDLTLDTRYYLALAFPFVLWVLLLIIGIIKNPSPKEKARWLAGAINFDNSRSWIVLYFVLPLLLLLSFTLFSLGGGEGAYPAATWSTMAVLAISLIGVAFSGGKYESAFVKSLTILRKEVKLVKLKPWPEAVTAQGITLQKDIAIWEKQSTPTRAVRGHSTENLSIHEAKGLSIYRVRSEGE